MAASKKKTTKKKSVKKKATRKKQIPKIKSDKEIKKELSDIPEYNQLNDKQKIWLQEYILSGSKIQATRKAGYAPHNEKTQHKQGHRLSRNEKIKTVINAIQKKNEDKFGITQEMIIAELAAMGFSSLKNVVKLAGDSITLKDLESMDDIDAAAIESISQSSGEQGSQFRIKMHNKANALEKLGKHYGMWKDSTGDAGSDSKYRESLISRVSQLAQRVRKRGTKTGSDNS